MDDLQQLHKRIAELEAGIPELRHRLAELEHEPQLVEKGSGADMAMSAHDPMAPQAHLGVQRIPSLNPPTPTTRAA